MTMLRASLALAVVLAHLAFASYAVGAVSHARDIAAARLAALNAVLASR